MIAYVALPRNDSISTTTTSSRIVRRSRPGGRSRSRAERSSIRLTVRWRTPLDFALRARGVRAHGEAGDGRPRGRRAPARSAAGRRCSPPTGGAGRVVVLERGLAGRARPRRAAGVVRAAGRHAGDRRARPLVVDFYRTGRRTLRHRLRLPRARLPDPRDDGADERAGRERVAMQREAGLDVRWVDAAEARRLNPTLAADGPPRRHATSPPTGTSTRRATCARTRWRCSAAGVELRERTAFLGPADGGRARRTAPRDGRARPTAGTIATERVLLTGGPSLRAVGALVGARILGRRGAAPGRGERAAPRLRRRTPADGLRHGGRPVLAPRGGRAALGHEQPERDARRGARDRHGPPAEDAAPAGDSSCRSRPGLGMRKAWAATIEYTPDHLPMLGTGRDDRRRRDRRPVGRVARAATA